MTESAEGGRLIDVGEYALHAWLRAALASSGTPTTQVGVGDDCAVLDVGIPGSYLLATTDRVPLSTDKSETGRFAVVHNVSDILAMRGVPFAFLLNIYLPRDALLRDFEDIVLGAREACKEYGLQVVGGDTKEDHKTTIVGTCLGLVSRDDLLLRSGAQPGDVVAITRRRGKELGLRWAYWVANYFGVCAEQLTQLHQEYLDQLQIPFEIMTRLRGVAGLTSCLDMTEGLLGAALLVAGASRVQMVLEHDRLQGLVSDRVAYVAGAVGKEPIAMLFNPGFDWENLLTLAPAQASRVLDQFEGEILPIGVVQAGEGVVIRRVGQADAPLAVFSDQKFMPYAWNDKAEAWRAMRFYD